MAPRAGAWGSEIRVPLADIAVVVLGHSQVTCSAGALAGLLRHGAATVVCDRDHLPTGMLLPIAGHSTQAERFAAQAGAGLPTKKRIWQQIVRRKIAAQAATLEALRQIDGGLRAMVPRVKSGDPENVEAQAAQRYWPLLFDNPEFRRRRDAEDANRFLNYGYAVLRAVTARGICASGLHPSLGVHHHNRYDAYCLADDLMEPFRPLVDEAAVECAGIHGSDAALSSAVKRSLLAPLLGLYRAEGEARTLFDWIARASASLAAVFLGESDRLELPEGLVREDEPDAAE
ncbi:MAG: type II CRISPR-associated endonuclease Cas1 [Planctomycetes bacterium]|nr:type II CRISPR-associated endonuclease Cas1 [Planctomycetota bacterium]